jgi:hypothetical protein
MFDDRSREPSNWDASHPYDFLGPAGGDFDEWRDLRVQFDSWIADASAFIKQLDQLRTARTLSQKYGPHQRFKVIRAGITGSTEAAVRIPNLAAAGLSFGKALKTTYDTAFEITLDDIDKAVNRNLVIRGQLQAVLRKFDSYLYPTQTPWDEILCQVYATAHVIKEARELRGRMFASFKEANEILRRK